MDEIRRILTDILSRIEKIEKGLVIKKITIPSDGYLVVKQLAADPITPVEGELWENTTTHHLKIYLNGVITTIV